MGKTRNVGDHRFSIVGPELVLESGNRDLDGFAIYNFNNGESGNSRNFRCLDFPHMALKSQTRDNSGRAIFAPRRILGITPHWELGIAHTIRERRRRITPEIIDCPYGGRSAPGNRGRGGFYYL